MGRKFKENSKLTKIGRNDPCLCGSGLKYKKCCIYNTHASASFNNPMSGKSEEKDNSSVQKTKQKRKNNHYVAIGYQKRFIPDGQKELHYLDLSPACRDLPDGRRVQISRELRRWGPGVCFCEDDLYTTKIFGKRNEDIETLLFGKIDNDISSALDGLVGNDPRMLHKYFQYIFEYIDAQKLRTPKGLEWIRSNYFQLTKDELLLEMQILRTMHCTMWVEGVMEIVSAEDSDIKFIISDHPVTIYNSACPPDTEICQYPNDPPTAWKASQTIFPLDLNHCLILTNLEFARSPDDVDPTSGRTNPRYFSQTITRWDTVIRERKLKSEEVLAINYIIKKRARKYIAAGRVDWLYPEKNFSNNEWKSLDKILLPPKDRVWQFGGEIYVGGKDGDLAWYQDAFGRRNTGRENENDPVLKYSISKRNEILNNAIFKIFGFDKGKSWDDFRNELTNDKIKELYGVVGGLWNPDTEITSLLPRPKNDELKAFYHGSIDPRIIPLTVVGYSLYVDKVIMYSPFFNPRAMNKEYSPFENPGQYRDETIKNIATMMELMPLIDTGILEMIPDPCEFNPELRMRTFKMAEARMKYRDIDKTDMDLIQKIMQEDIKKSMLNLPSDILRRKIEEFKPSASKEEVEEILDYMQKQNLADPLVSIQPMEVGEKGAQMHITKMSGTHEMALYLAQLTGAYVYTDVKHCWKEYKLSELKNSDEAYIDPWEPLVKALNEYHLIMYIDPDPRFWPRIKQKGYLKNFIELNKDVLAAVQTIKNSEEANAKAKEFADRLKEIKLEDIFNKIEVDYKQEFKKGEPDRMTRKVKIPASYFFPLNGISSNRVTQILLTNGISTSYWDSVPFGVYLNLNEAGLI